jgi:hypothetical protein
MQSSAARRPAGRTVQWLCAVLALAGAGSAGAAQIEVSLGNTASSLVPGQEVTIFDILAAQAGQVAPFDQGYGSDPIENFLASFTFLFGPVGGEIVAASIEFGLYDADAGSPGSQVDSFDVAGNDLAGAANAAFESTGGASSVYDVYTVDLGSVLASLAGGSVSVSLGLHGPVQSPDLFDPDKFVIEDFNGAALIYSTLRITTRTTSVPEPAGVWLLGSGLAALAAARRRRLNRT